MLLMRVLHDLLTALWPQSRQTPHRRLIFNTQHIKWIQWKFGFCVSFPSRFWLR